LVCVGVGLVPHLAAVIRSTSLHFLYVFSRFTFSVLAFSIRARSSFALLFPLIPGRFFPTRAFPQKTWMILFLVRSNNFAMRF
jgi:hypothetical protein